MAKSHNRLVKNSGQVFTPDFLVRCMLDYAGYVGESVLQRHVMDNSCGAGAFLCEAVGRYCEAYLAKNGSVAGLAEELALYVHGIEIEPSAYAACLHNLAQKVQAYGLQDVAFDIRCEDALGEDDFDGRMDFVVGNPPYVRVHNLEANYGNVKKFAFAQDGMTDIYLVFFEIGFRMLAPAGRMCYITPISWLTSLAGTPLRRYILRERTLSGLIDLGHYQAFEGATTYTLISMFDKSRHTAGIVYNLYDAQAHKPVAVDRLTFEDIEIGGSFYFGRREELSLLRRIKQDYARPFVKVKNGFATLADKVFITDVPFQTFTIPVLKASTGKWYRGFFPYDRKGKPLSKEEIFSVPEVRDYLNARKSELLKTSTEEASPTWYLYGRTQALRDVFVRKYAVNTLLCDPSSLKLTEVPAGAGVFSGLYVLTDVPCETLRAILGSEDFMSYLRLLRNYKSGGYYTFSSKDLEQFLNYQLTNHVQTEETRPDDGCRVLQSHRSLF